MEEDIEERMGRIHGEENGSEIVSVKPQAPEELRNDAWKIDGMSVEELEALEQLELLLGMAQKQQLLKLIDLEEHVF